MTDFLTGCTHFGHANIIRLTGRPFADIDQMDRALITNWNAVAQPQDTVYHLGDFAFRQSGDAKEKYLSRLNGKIVLLQGNHDPKDWGADYLTVKSHGTRAVLFHYPIEEWDGWYRGAVHFHCHTHAKDFVSGERRGNVGVDATISVLFGWTRRSPGSRPEPAPSRVGWVSTHPCFSASTHPCGYGRSCPHSPWAGHSGGVSSAPRPCRGCRSSRHSPLRPPATRISA